MHSECPHCKAVFRVTPRQLAVAKGMVRCGQCRGVFNAAKSLKPQQPAVIQREAASAKRPTIADLVASADRAGRGPQKLAEAPTAAANEAIHQRSPNLGPPNPGSPNPVLPTGEAAATQEDIRSAAQQLTLDVSRDETADLIGDPSPGGASEDEIPSLLLEDLAPKVKFRRYSGWSTILWSAGIIMLIVLMIAQYFYHEREQLAQYPQLHQYLVRGCQFLGCRIEPLAAPERIELVSRNIYTHPDEESALMIVATLVNRADYPQPFPLMRVSLTNLQGSIIASRSFRPDEYAPEYVEDGRALMEPGTPVNIGLEVMDPGSNAMAFQFDFL